MTQNRSKSKQPIEKDLFGDLLNQAEYPKFSTTQYSDHNQDTFEVVDTPKESNTQQSRTKEQEERIQQERALSNTITTLKSSTQTMSLTMG